MIEHKVILQSAAVLAFVAFEFVFPNFSPHKSPLKRKYFLQDILFLFINMTMAGAIVYYCVHLIILGHQEWGIQFGFEVFRNMSWTGQFICAFIIRDFMAYWMHRFSHHRVFWRFHVTHHESDYLDAVASFRVHPVNFILNASRAPLLLLFGFNFSLLPVMGLLQFVHNIFVHANLRIDFGPLNYIFVSPQLHRVHHGNKKYLYTKNFGVYLSIWDIIFGTFQNTKDLKFEVGISGHIRQNFIATTIKPFLPSQNRKTSATTTVTTIPHESDVA